MIADLHKCPITHLLNEDEVFDLLIAPIVVIIDPRFKFLLNKIGSKKVKSLEEQELRGNLDREKIEYDTVTLALSKKEIG